MRKQVMAGALVAVAAGAAVAQPVVPDGFTARRIAPRLDNQIPRMTAVSHPGFGSGVIASTVANGVLTVWLITPSGQIDTVGVWNGAPVQARPLSVRLDTAVVIDGMLHVTVHDTAQNDTHYVTMDSLGGATERWERTTDENYFFDITRGEAGNPIGSVLLDQNRGSGTRLAWMDASYNVTVVNNNSLPPGRTDTDVVGFQRDVSGRYGGGVLMADWDTNHDRRAAIYELRDVLTGGSYRTISNVSSGSRRYGDLAIAEAGDFGGVIYITEQYTNQVQQVAPDGTHSTWASGFFNVDSLAISPDGNSMYVGDIDGVWLIRRSGNEPGPVILTSEPSIPPSSVLTGDAVTSLRIIFSEPVTFNDADVTITDGRGDPVAFDASGSGSQFMLIGLGRPLFGDTYTITIADSVTSVATGEALDGDGDGFAGGDAVIDITHQCPADMDGNGEADVNDFFLFLDWFAAGCGG